MKRINITCPACGSRAYLRPASVVYGDKAPDPDAKYYVCGRYPACDCYVAAHRKTMLPMGTLADKALRKKRHDAHVALDSLWKNGVTAVRISPSYIKRNQTTLEPASHGRRKSCAGSESCGSSIPPARNKISRAHKEEFVWQKKHFIRHWDISAAETMAEAGVIQSFSWITVSSEWIRRR